MSVYKLHGIVGANTDSLANLDIQFDGIIVGWFATCNGLSADALNDGFKCEVSFLSSNTFTSNDARGTIMQVQGGQAFLTQGGAGVFINRGMSGLSIPVTAGERIHMHVNISGGINCDFTVILYVEDTADVNLRRRR